MDDELNFIKESVAASQQNEQNAFQIFDYGYAGPPAVAFQVMTQHGVNLFEMKGVHGTLS